jgi:NAD(P)-dependent dehydrogenase (short-subunit alcohol dehydrogenase family)
LAIPLQYGYNSRKIEVYYENIPMNTKSYKSPYRSDLLANKIALVTGAGKGIGRECALSLAACGARVIAAARTETDLLSLVEEADGVVTPWQMDASSAAFLEKVNELDQLDILVNNLGTNTPQMFTEVDADTFERMLDLNVRSVFKISQCAVRNMLAAKKPGSIINITSQMGHVGSPGRTVYCMTKHAIEGLTKAMSVELAPQGIRVNAVAPTFIETPLTAPMFDDEVFSKFVLDRIPMGKIGSTVDVANAVVYLASEASALVTGTSLKVDGGWTAQ